MRLKLAINSSRKISKHLSNIWLLWNQTLFTLALLEEHLVKQSRAWNSIKQSLAPGRDLLRLATGPPQPHSDQCSSPLDQPKEQHANLQLMQTPRASLVFIAVKILWYFFFRRLTNHYIHRNQVSNTRMTKKHSCKLCGSFHGSCHFGSEYCDEYLGNFEGCLFLLCKRPKRSLRFASWCESVKWGANQPIHFLFYLSYKW